MDKYAAPDVILECPVDAAFGRPVVRGAYADDDRKYPIDNPASAWLSAASYFDSGSTDRKVAAALQTALNEHRLGDEWERLSETADMYRRTKAAAEAPKAFALNGRFPIDTDDRVIAAVSYFAKHASAFSHDDRAAFATAVVRVMTDAVKRASDPAAVRRIEAEAGLGRPASDWRRAVTDRARLSDDPAATEVLNKIASAPLTDPMGLVRDLRDLDAIARWDLPDPIDTVIGETPSTAAAKLASVVPAPSGNWYRRSDLSRVSDGAVAELFASGEVPVFSVEKRAALLTDPTTGPEFERVLNDHDVKPVQHSPHKTDWKALVRP